MSVTMCMLYTACSEAGHVEQSIGARITATLHKELCGEHDVSPADPCGEKDARFEASAGVVMINIYGIKPPDIQMQKKLVNLATEYRENNIVIELRFYELVTSGKEYALQRIK